MNFMENFEQAEKMDKLRTKMIKYILYKKRTEQEIRQKFSEEDPNMIEDAIAYFKELNYINDANYIQKSVQEFIHLKNLSIKEITYKLYQKGITKTLLEEYIAQHQEELQAYEINSAKVIWNKKIQNTDENSVKEFLYKKGYLPETLHVIFEK